MQTVRGKPGSVYFCKLVGQTDVILQVWESKNESGPGCESLMSNNMEEGVVLTAFCNFLLPVAPIPALPLTRHSYSKMSEECLLQKFHSLS